MKISEAGWIVLVVLVFIISIIANIAMFAVKATIAGEIVGSML